MTGREGGRSHAASASGAAAETEVIRQQIADLIRGASIEANVQDEQELDASLPFLPPGTRVFISHLPGQTWNATTAMCRSVAARALVPVPHLPVRLIESADVLYRVLDALVTSGGVREALVIAGDYQRPVGPYSEALQVLRSGALQRHGIASVCLAAYPERHPRISDAELRDAESRKASACNSGGLSPAFVTQFLFEAEPFCRWAEQMRGRGLGAPLVCGITGPARVRTLFRYAVRCGVGSSIRALGTRPSATLGFLGGHEPDRVLRDLADARISGRCDISGVHIFTFGGFSKTARWKANVASGGFDLTDVGFACR